MAINEENEAVDTLLEIFPSNQCVRWQCLAYTQTSKQIENSSRIITQFVQGIVGIGSMLNNTGICQVTGTEVTEYMKCGVGRQRVTTWIINKMRGLGK